MAALTLEQLRARSRAKFPVTVVRDEYYPTMTPMQIAAAWSAYSGGTDGVYLQNVAGTWAEMDPDLPKANDRGLLVFGGGKQYAQRCDFADVTEGQAFPGNNFSPYWIRPNELTLICADKDTEDGLPYVTVQFSGIPTSEWCGWNQAPGYVVVPHAEAGTGDIVSYRQTIEILSLPVQVTNASLELWQYGSVAGEQLVSYGITPGYVTKEITKTDAGEAIDYWGFGIRLGHAADVAFASAAQIKMFPALISVNTAFPDHFHCLNTSTTAAATIVPEIVQRPAQLDKPWSMAIVASTGKRDLGAHQVIWCSSTDADNYVRVYRATSTGQITLHVRAAGVDYTKALGVIALSTTFRLSIRATAQVFTASLNGGDVQTLAAPRPATLTAESLGHHYDGTLCGWSTIESLTTRTGLATDAQLLQWSTAA